MPPKSSNTGKESLIDDEEELLQAVILADSFNKRFKPLTISKPRCLLPICNAPLLDWTFESLSLAGVQEIFVICRSHADLVRAAIRESKWSKPSCGLKVIPILLAKETFSPGDAMRDIYTRGLITSDFVLVYGDMVSNVRIDEVVKLHRERRKTNKDAIMTMVVKESGAKHRTRSRGDSSVFVLDAESSECLHYEPVIGYPPKSQVGIPREILAEHPEVEIRNDLIDCSIDVCSVEVPSLFQDNFDWLDLRRDFVHGVLTSDLLMKSIHCYVVKEGYAARVKDTQSYDSISKDILARWTFPLVPDDNHPAGHIYEHLRGNRYVAKDNTVVLSRTCKVGNNTMIGSLTHVFDNAQVISSVIGQRCRIGVGSIIRNSYIFDGTVIGANCVIENSIIGAKVQIKDESRVERGCLVADGVVLGPEAKLRPFERVSKRREGGEEDDDDGGEEESDDEHEEDGDNEDEGEEDDDDDDDEDIDDEDEDEESDSELEEAEANQAAIGAILGKDSNGIALPLPSVAEDEDGDDEIETFNNQRLMRIGDNASDLELTDPGSVTSSEVDSDSEDEDDMLVSGVTRASSATSLPLNMPSTEMLVPALTSAAEKEFQSEVSQSLERAFAEGHSVDNAAVELKTLRMSTNVPLRRVREAVIAGIVEQIPIVEGNIAEQRKEITNVMDRWGELIDKIGGVDAIETVSILQAHCASSPRLPLFGQILAALYQKDLVEEDDIRQWHKQSASTGEGLKPGTFCENIQKCWAIGTRMIQQFDAQEESEEDSDEGIEEEDDEQEEEE